MQRTRVYSPVILHNILYILFFCSGCSALIYQITWQRMLFTQLGVDIISITIIVSVFMWGLGLGGLGGGWLADRFPLRRLQFYIGIELAIASFALLSPSLIRIGGALTVSSSMGMTALCGFAIFALPTFLMGATFPLLVMHVNTALQNIGRAVGSLYIANTLGAALGAYLSGFLLLYFMGINNVIHLGAFLNATVALIAYLFFWENQ